MLKFKIFIFSKVFINFHIIFTLCGTHQIIITFVERHYYFVKRIDKMRSLDLNRNLRFLLHKNSYKMYFHISIIIYNFFFKMFMSKIWKYFGLKN